MKKSQIQSQIFIYVLATAITSFIIYYGYVSISSFKEKTDSVSCIKLENDLKEAIKAISAEYGTVRKHDIRMCARYSRICFLETFNSYVPQALAATRNLDPIIKGSILDKTGKNTFLVEDIAERSFYSGNISVEPDVSCFDSRDTIVSIRIEGKGDHVFISKWQ